MRETPNAPPTVLNIPRSPTIVATFLGINSMHALSWNWFGNCFSCSNNACIELMPEKVATIVGLRGMFRTVGGALGVSLITFILHLSSDPVNGFRMTFISFGLGLLFAIPLVFLMPTGKKEYKTEIYKVDMTPPDKHPGEVL